MKNIITILLVFISLQVQAKINLLEKDYQNAFCNFIGGKTEVVLDNKRRVDCLDDTYAIEVDFVKKIFEGIGQSEYYAFKTNKKAGLLLIVKNNDDLRVVTEFHDYLINYKYIVYIIIYSKNNNFYVIKPENIKDIPKTLDKFNGLEI